MKPCFVLLSAVVAHGAAHAQFMPTTFPADAVPITPELFAEKVAGHSYRGFAPTA